MFCVDAASPVTFCLEIPAESKKSDGMVPVTAYTAAGELRSAWFVTVLFDELLGAEGVNVEDRIVDQAHIAVIGSVKFVDVG